MELTKDPFLSEAQLTTERALAQDGLTNLHDSTLLQTEESKLIELSQRGNREAFAILSDRYWQPLFRWLLQLSRHTQTAEDLTQETLLKAFAAIHTFRMGDNCQLRAWLFRIAHNSFINSRRHTARMRQDFPVEMVSDGPGPAEEVISKEVTEKVRKAIQKLPVLFRVALLLRVDEDLSFREIADVLQITEETARWRVFKARQKLVASLGSCLFPNREDEEER